MAPSTVVATVYVLALVLIILDTTIVSVALKSLGDEFDVPVSSIQWVVTGYLVSLAVWMPASGWFGDRFGTKRTFLVALGIFTVASGAVRPRPVAAGARRLPRPAGRRRRAAHTRRVDDAVARLPAGTAGRRLTGADDPARLRTRHRADARWAPHRHRIVALGVPRQRPGRRRRPRVRRPAAARASRALGAGVRRRRLRPCGPGSRVSPVRPQRGARPRLDDRPGRRVGDRRGGRNCAAHRRRAPGDGADAQLAPLRQPPVPHHQRRVDVRQRDVHRRPVHGAAHGPDRRRRVGAATAGSCRRPTPSACSGRRSWRPAPTHGSVRAG